MNELTRRDMLKITGAGVAGSLLAGPSILTAASNKDFDATRKVVSRSGFGPALPDERGFAYFGEPNKKPAKTGFNPYHYKKANKVDFGLSSAQEERAANLHKSLQIFDGEMEVTYYDGFIENVLSSGAKSAGGSYTIDALCYELFNGEKDPKKFEIKPSDWWTQECMDRDILFIDKIVKKYKGKVKLCKNYADLVEAGKNGQMTIMMDAQNTRFLRGDLSNLDFYYEKGLRRVQLSYNRQEMTASGCMETVDAGLSVFGKEVIGRMNKLNMLVDTGHCSSKTMSDAIDASTAPIICSHAGLRAISPNNPRTHTDEGLKKLAEHGGVFGVVGVPGTLTDNLEHASVKDFVNAIHRAVNIMGIDHVGFALDQPQGASMQEFLTAPEWPAAAVESVGVSNWPWSDTFYGMENHTGYINLTRGLVWKGFSDEDIRKIMGGNMMRLIKEVIG